jgi:hypothetical protein
VSRRRESTEVQLDRLADLRGSPSPRAELVEELRRLLRARSAHVAAKTAQLAAELELEELIPDLREAFESRMVDSVRRDPQCAAKTAIASALVTLDASALVTLEETNETVFLRGIRHVQREPVWGGTVDTAAELRGLCALGLAAAGHPGSSLELVRLLVDPETQARVLGTRAVAGSGFLGAEELLRLKVHSGDSEQEVLVEALAGLMHIAPERSVELARELLAGDDSPRAAAAALALGEARPRGAFELLATALEAGHPETAITLLALATLRSEPALELLLKIVAEAPGHLAREALRALAVYRDDEALADRVRAATEARNTS